MKKMMSTLALLLCMMFPSLCLAATTTFTNPYWAPVGVAGFSAAEAHTAMAVAPDGTPYIAYTDWSFSGSKATVKKYVKDANGVMNWNTVGTAGFSSGPAYSMAIAVDKYNIPYVAYVDVSTAPYTVKINKLNGSVWDLVGSTSGGSNPGPSLAVDTTGALYLGFQDNNTHIQVLKYAGNAWSMLGGAPVHNYVGMYPSVAIHPGDNLPYLAYRDDTNGYKPVVQKFNGTTWSIAGTNPLFSVGTVDYVSLAFASDGTAYVAYKDQSTGNKATLKTLNASNSWVEVGATNGLSAGLADYLSLIIAPDKSPCVAYVDRSNGSKATVKKYNISTSSWGDLGNAGFSNGETTNVSLALGSDGTPYLAYRDVAHSNKATVMKLNNIAPQVSAGASHTCGVKPDGTVACWGLSTSGRTTPPVATSFYQVVAGGSHSCGVKADSTVACWGSVTFAQTTPPAGDFLQLSAGASHNCGVKTDGTVACWGAGTTNTGATPYYGQAITPLGTFSQVGAGLFHTCGLKTDGTIACWGYNYYGQSTPPASTYFTQASAGNYHTCGVKTDGTVTCWGAGKTNTGTSSNYGQSMDPVGTFTQVSAGFYHTCGIKADGAVACWGAGTTNTGVSPNYGQAIAPTGTFTQLDSGDTHTCGVKTDGTTLCWGENTNGKAPVISITPLTITNGVVGASYSPTTLTASGATAPYSFMIVSGTLPPGLSLSSLGVHSGTPTTAGSYSFAFEAVDSSIIPLSGTQAYTLTIDAPIAQVAPATLNFGNIAPLSSSVHQTVTLSNSGPSTLLVSDITMTGSDPTQFTITLGTCLSLKPTIAPSSNCTVNIIFAPTSIGSKIATLRVASNDLVNPVQLTALSGDTILCGISNGAIFTVVPTTNLCTIGTASAVAGTGPWTWTCSAGITANCSANLQGTVVIPKTGQITCYDPTGNTTNEIPCAGNGQDGDTQVGAAQTDPVFTDTGTTITDKVYGMTWNKDAATDGATMQRGISGVPAKRFTDNNNGTQTDNLTGLIWLKNADCFFWQNWETALNKVKTLEGDNSQCNLTDGSVAGDWRLPNINELVSLPTNWTGNIPADWLNAAEQGFLNVSGDVYNRYWSSSSIAGNTDYAWIVSMYGYVEDLPKNDNYDSKAWPVRGGKSGSLGSLTLSKDGTGTGSVGSSPERISCGATCTANFAAGKEVVLTATADSGSSFSGWKGCNSSNANQCTVTATGTKNVTATFTLTSSLTVNLPGSGRGTVSSIVGITPMLSCATPQTSCSASVASGANVTLSATESLGSAPVVWSGACSNVPCSFKMEGDKTVTADFAVHRYLKNGVAYYGTVKDALATAKSSETVKAKTMQMLDSGVTFDTGLLIFLYGGYANIDDAASSGYTTLVGPLKIKSGTLKVDRVKVK